MSKRVYARLYEREVAAVIRLAEAERRHPCEQAGLLISEALRERGALDDPEREAGRHPAAPRAAVREARA